MITMRTIICNDSTNDCIDKFEKSLHRFADAFNALQWLLCRNPDIGHHLYDGWYLYVQAPDLLAGTPEIWVLYKFNEDEVSISALHAERSEALE